MGVLNGCKSLSEVGDRSHLDPKPVWVSGLLCLYLNYFNNTSTSSKVTSRIACIYERRTIRVSACFWFPIGRLRFLLRFRPKAFHYVHTPSVFFHLSDTAPWLMPLFFVRNRSVLSRRIMRRLYANAPFVSIVDSKPYRLLACPSTC